MGKIYDFSAYSTVKKSRLNTPRIKVDWRSYMTSAYEWCEGRIAKYAYTKPISMSINKLTEHGDCKKDEGLFMSSDEKTLIFRVYDPETQQATYRYLMNIDKLRDNQPELFEYYLKAGVLSYLEQVYPYLVDVYKEEKA
jgi:hypothetical protein